MKTIKVHISGAVQGVFFRKFIKEKADEFRVRGYVRNLEDGRVEVVIEGLDERVAQMLKACKEGYPHSQIRDVQVQDMKFQGFSDFRISSL